MKKTLIASLVASTFLLGACSQQAPTESTTAAVIAEMTAQAELGSFGIELDARDL